MAWSRIAFVSRNHMADPEPTDRPHSAVPPGAARRVDADTFDLLTDAQAGRRSALELLFARQYDALRRWSRGRLPTWARGAADTADMVQDALTRVLGRVDRIDVRSKGALAAYLRRSIHNRIVDEMRYVGLRPSVAPDTMPLRDPSPSVFDAIASEQDQQRYKAALSRLTKMERDLIVGAVELGYNHEQLALATGKRTAGSARVALSRAIRRVVEEMRAT